MCIQELGAELQGEIKRLEQRILNIEHLDPNGIMALHYFRHQMAGEEIARAHDRLDWMDKSVKQLQAEVKRIRDALLKLASDEAVHDLLG